MPFSEEGNLLLPATTCQTELWPMLLSKAIIKLANTRYVLVNSLRLLFFVCVKLYGIWKKISTCGEYISLKVL